MDKLKHNCFYDTPPLWEGEKYGILQFVFPQIDLNIFQAGSIPHNLRLGHQMEHVFKQLIGSSTAYEIVVYNLPIKRDKRTIGEIDFILQDTITKQLLHVELTYKFYLIDPKISELTHRLVGPNRRDSFYKKLQKIKSKQFPLVHTEEGGYELCERDIDHLDIVHRCCFKAQIFAPYRNTTMDIGPLNNNCVEGYWLTLDDFGSDEFTMAQYYLPNKSEWVVHPHNQVDWENSSSAREKIEKNHQHNRAPMLWKKSSDGIIEKLFVVGW